jgi:alpha-tubulin suppressor-like RCC1 family protein
VGGLVNPTAVFTGGNSTCAIASGTLLCWGDDYYGQLGDANSGSYSASPVVVSGGLTSIAQVGVGSSRSCAVLTSGATYCWGDNSGGQFGNGTTTTTAMTTPVASGFSDAVAIAVGDDQTCAIVRDGSVWCAGTNAEGQLGNDTTIDSSVPVQVAPW